MLTQHDRTVKDALIHFNSVKDIKDAHYWGFKDVGLPREEMKELVGVMKTAGKTVFMEVVTYTETSCRKAAELAVECKFDCLAGTIFYPSVLKVLKEGATSYMPFCGKVSGSPSILEGTGDEIITEAKKLLNAGADGFDLLAYRHTSEDPVKLSRRFINEIAAPVVIAGSIDCFDRLDIIKELNPWGFTIGGAFFEKKFVPGGTYREQLEAVLDYMGK